MKIERQLAVWALCLIAGGVISVSAFAATTSAKSESFHPVVKPFVPVSSKHAQHSAVARVQKSHTVKLAKAHVIPGGKIAVAHAGKTTAHPALKIAAAHPTIVHRSTNPAEKTSTFVSSEKIGSSLSIARNNSKLAAPSITTREMHAAIRANYNFAAVTTEHVEAYKINRAIAENKFTADHPVAAINLASAAVTTKAPSASTQTKISVPVLAAKIASSSVVAAAPAKTIAPAIKAAEPVNMVVALNPSSAHSESRPEDLANAQRIIPAANGGEMVAINDQPPIHDAVKIVTGDLSKDEFYVFGINERVPDDIITRPNTQIAVLGGTEEEAASKMAAFKIAMKKALDTKMIADKTAAVKVIVAVQSTEKAISEIKKTVRSKFLDSSPKPTNTVINAVVNNSAESLSVPNTLGGAPKVTESAEKNIKTSPAETDVKAPVALTPAETPELDRALSASKDKTLLEDRIVVPEVKLVKIKKLKLAPSMELASLHNKTRA